MDFIVFTSGWPLTGVLVGREEPKNLFISSNKIIFYFESQKVDLTMDYLLSSEEKAKFVRIRVVGSSRGFQRLDFLKEGLVGNLPYLWENWTWWGPS